VTEREFSFELPATLPAGEVALHVVNAGSQPHELILVRLNGVSAEQYREAVATPSGTPPPSTPLKSVAALLPGASSGVSVTLPPGEYALVCFLNDPATGRTHASLGMVQGLTIEPGG
jgi:hypothetical protein